MLNTERLRIYPASREQMEVMTASEQDEELRKAYIEMLEGCLRHPDQWDWYASWMIERKDGTHIGDLCFKGLREDGIAEIGYGILEEYRGQGYAAEAVQAACRWAFQQEGVKSLEAETDARNFASQRVHKELQGDYLPRSDKRPGPSPIPVRMSEKKQVDRRTAPWRLISKKSTKNSTCQRINPAS